MKEQVLYAGTFQREQDWWKLLMRIIQEDQSLAVREKRFVRPVLQDRFFKRHRFAALQAE